jgi:hypothetical protein
MWWFMPVISALRRRQKNEEFKASLDYTVRLKKKKKKSGFLDYESGDQGILKIRLSL